MIDVSSTSTDATDTPSASSSWFDALARAWGAALDAQAQKITTMSDAIGDGAEHPSDMALLTAESQRMAFMSNSASNSINAVAQSLETLARKQ